MIVLLRSPYNFHFPDIPPPNLRHMGPHMNGPRHMVMPPGFRMIPPHPHMMPPNGPPGYIYPMHVSNISDGFKALQWYWKKSNVIFRWIIFLTTFHRLHICRFQCLDNKTWIQGKYYNSSFHHSKGHNSRYTTCGMIVEIIGMLVNSILVYMRQRNEGNS